MRNEKFHKEMLDHNQKAVEDFYREVVTKRLDSIKNDLESSLLMRADFYIRYNRLPEPGEIWNQYMLKIKNKNAPA